MRTAIPRATNGKNRSTLGAIFSAARAARAAKFGRLVVLEKAYRVSKTFPYYYFWFRITIHFWKTKIFIFLKNSSLFRKYLHTVS